jgi:hypothetical protein
LAETSVSIHERAKYRWRPRRVGQNRRIARFATDQKTRAEFRSIGHFALNVVGIRRLKPHAAPGAHMRQRFDRALRAAVEVQKVLKERRPDARRTNEPEPGKPLFVR